MNGATNGFMVPPEQANPNSNGAGHPPSPRPRRGRDRIVGLEPSAPMANRPYGVAATNGAPVSPPPPIVKAPAATREHAAGSQGPATASSLTLQGYLKILHDRWLVILVAIVLALSVAAGTWWLRPPQYTAELTMYVSAQTADNAQSAYQGAQLSQQRVTSYVELVNSTRVSQEVVRDLNLTESAEDLSKEIAASSALDSVLIDVKVTDPSSQRAADIANSIGRVFSALVDELERPTVVGAQPPVAVRVVLPAAVPTKPSSMSLPTILTIGLLAGLILGVSAALARNALDSSVKSHDQLRRAVGAPNLGTITFDADVPNRPLTVHEDPQSSRAEAFRQLRTNLQFIDVDHPRKVIVVTSSMPGEGKTTTLANLGVALASAGQRVLLIDADLRRPKLAELFGLDRSVGLTSVLSGRTDLQHSIQLWAGGLEVLASGQLPPNPSELLASGQMRNLLGQLRRQFDVVLIDTPPLLPVTDAAAVAPAADGVILACRFKATSQDQVGRAAEAISAVSAPILGTVFTMVKATRTDAYTEYGSYHRLELPPPRHSSSRPHLDAQRGANQNPPGEHASH